MLLFDLDVTLCFSLLVSMAPLSSEIRSVSSCTPQHIGPAIPEVHEHLHCFIDNSSTIVASTLSCTLL